MYLEIDEGFPGHRKTLRLSAALKNTEAPWFVIRLWTWACRSAPDGDLTGMDPYDIEIAAQYRQLDGACYAAMVSAGFIDETDGRPAAIHNWMKRTGGAIAKMAAAADRKALYRIHKAGKCCVNDCPFCIEDAASEDSPRTGDGQSQDKTDTDKTRQDQSSQDKAREREPSLAGDPAGPEGGAVAREVIQEAFRSALAEDQPKPWTAGGWKRHFGEFWVSRYGGNAYGGGVDASKVCGIFDDHLAALPTEARLKAQARAPAMFTKYFGDRKLASMKHPFRFFVDRFDSLRTDGEVVNGAQPARRQTDRPEIPSYFREAKSY